jgi:hypothetical protein
LTDNDAFMVEIGKNGLISQRTDFVHTTMGSIVSDLWREDSSFRGWMIAGAIGAFVVAIVGAFFTGGGTLVGYFSALATIGAGVLGVGVATAIIAMQQTTKF